MAITTYTNSNTSPLFKRVWGEYGSQLYGTGAEDPGYAVVKKTFKLKGSQEDFPLDLSFGGGVGYVSLPESDTSNKVTVVITRIKAYARMKLDRETMVASKGKEGAFKDVTQYETMAKLRSFMRIQACSFYNYRTAILGQFSGSTSGTAASPVVTVLNTGTYKFRQAFFEEGDRVNVLTGAGTVLPSVWRIESVVLSTRVVTLSRVAGSDDLTAIGAGTHSLVLQNSYNGAPYGVKELFEATGGTLYGVTVQRRFRAAVQDDAGAASISVDHLNKGAIDLYNLTGEYPTHIIGATKQYMRLLNKLGDARRYTEVLSASNKLSKVRMAYRGLALDTQAGEIPFLPSRYVEDDRVYFINDGHLEFKHAEDFGWFDEDGNMLDRIQGEDAYEARFGGYYNLWGNPFFGGYTGNFAV